MPLLFTPAVCENVSRGELSRHLPGGQFTLRPRNRSSSRLSASAAAAGKDFVFHHPLSDSDYRIVSCYLPAEPLRYWDNVVSINLMRRELVK